jgi:hypothetical protein
VRIWRNKQLVVERSGDETLVLDVAASRVHRLNSDGLAVMDATVNGPCDVGPGLHDAAGELVDAGVLHTDSWSRRRFIGRTVGAAIVTTVLLPTATAAASTEPFVGPEVRLSQVEPVDDLIFRPDDGEVFVRAEWDPVSFEDRTVYYLPYTIRDGDPLTEASLGTIEGLSVEFPAEEASSWTVFIQPWCFNESSQQVFGAFGARSTITMVYP